VASFFTDFLAASCQFRLESEKRIFSYAGSADPPVTDLPRSMTLIEKPGRARLPASFLCAGCVRESNLHAAESWRRRIGRGGARCNEAADLRGRELQN
jgi:hypothetical protein